MPTSTRLNLDTNLNGGVVPISKAASSLAALLKRSRLRQEPIVVTQKGYPRAVLLSIELYSTLRQLAEMAPEAPSPSWTGAQDTGESTL